MKIEKRLAEVTKFAEARDKKGRLLRPDFDKRAKLIARIIRVMRADGIVLTLPEAYTVAQLIWRWECFKK